MYSYSRIHSFGVPRARIPCRLLSRSPPGDLVTRPCSATGMTAGLIMLLVAAAPARAETDTRTITLIHLNDLHAHLVPHLDLVRVESGADARAPHAGRRARRSGTDRHADPTHSRGQPQQPADERRRHLSWRRRSALHTGQRDRRARRRARHRRGRAGQLGLCVRRSRHTAALRARAIARRSLRQLAAGRRSHRAPDLPEPRCQPDPDLPSLRVRREPVAGHHPVGGGRRTSRLHRPHCRHRAEDGEADGLGLRFPPGRGGVPDAGRSIERTAARGGRRDRRGDERARPAQGPPPRRRRTARRGRVLLGPHPRGHAGAPRIGERRARGRGRQRRVPRADGPDAARRHPWSDVAGA